MRRLFAISVLLAAMVASAHAQRMSMSTGGFGSPTFAGAPARFGGPRVMGPRIMGPRVMGPRVMGPHVVGSGFVGPRMVRPGGTILVSTGATVPSRFGRNGIVVRTNRSFLGGGFFFGNGFVFNGRFFFGPRFFSHRHHRFFFFGGFPFSNPGFFSPFFSPFFGSAFGGSPFWGWGGDPVYANAPPMVLSGVPQTAEAEPVVLYEPAQPQPAPAPPEELAQPQPSKEPAKTAPELPPTVLVFKDQHRVEVRNYAIVGPTLYQFAPSRTKKIPIAQLDIPATMRVNEERGVTFRLPAHLKEVVTYP